MHEATRGIDNKGYRARADSLAAGMVELSEVTCMQPNTGQLPACCISILKAKAPACRNAAFAAPGWGQHTSFWTIPEASAAFAFMQFMQFNSRFMQHTAN